MNIFNVFLYNILREKYKKPYSLFGSLEREGSRGEGRRVKGKVIFRIVWMFLKLVRVKGVISHLSCLDVLKIRKERRGNYLNRQIYPYLKMDLQHKSMINLLVRNGKLGNLFGQ